MKKLNWNTKIWTSCTSFLQSCFGSYAIKNLHISCLLSNFDVRIDDGGNPCHLETALMSWSQPHQQTGHCHHKKYREGIVSLKEKICMYHYQSMSTCPPHVCSLLTRRYCILVLLFCLNVWSNNSYVHRMSACRLLQRWSLLVLSQGLINFSHSWWFWLLALLWSPQLALSSQYDVQEQTQCLAQNDCILMHILRVQYFLVSSTFSLPPCLRISLEQLHYGCKSLLALQAWTCN
jgi:hypothetical protein